MSSNKRPKTCHVRGCFSSSKDGTAMVFFAFPQLYDQMFEAWFNFANPETVTPRWICDRHFDKHQYEDRIKAKLHRYAAPTLYPGLPTPDTKEASPAKKAPRTKKIKVEKVVPMVAPENSRIRRWSNPTSVPKTFGIGQYIPPRHAPPNFTQNLNRYGSKSEQDLDDDGFLPPKPIISATVVRTADGFIIPGEVNRAPPNFIQTLNHYEPSNNAKNYDEKLKPSPTKVRRLSKKSKEPSDEIAVPDINMAFYKKLSESLPRDLPISTTFKQALEELEEATKKGTISNSNSPNNHSGGLNSSPPTSHSKNLGSQVTNQSSTKSTTLMLKPSSKKVDLNIDKSSFQTALKSKPKIITIKHKVQAGKQNIPKAKSKSRRTGFPKTFVQSGKQNINITKPSTEAFPKVLYGTPKSLSQATNLHEQEFVNEIPDKSVPATRTMNIPDSRRLVKVDPKYVPESVKKMNQLKHLRDQTSKSKERTTDDADLGTDGVKLVTLPLKSIPGFVKMKARSMGNSEPHKSRPMEPAVKERGEIDLKNVENRYDNHNDFTHHDHDYSGITTLKSFAIPSPVRNSETAVQHFKIQKMSNNSLQLVPQPAVKQNLKMNKKNKTLKGSTSTLVPQSTPDIDASGDDDDDDDVICLGSVSSSQTNKASDNILKTASMTITQDELHTALWAPKKPASGPSSSNDAVRVPDKLKLVKVDPKSVPEHIRIMLEGKGNKEPVVEKPAESPSVIHLKKQITAEILGTNKENDDTKSRELAIKPFTPEAQAELWEAYEEFKRDSNLDFISFVDRMVKSMKMTPKLKEAAVRFSSKVQRTYSKCKSADSTPIQAKLKHFIQANNDGESDVIHVKSVRKPSGINKSLGHILIKSVSMQKCKEKLAALLHTFATEPEAKGPSDSVSSEIDNPAFGTPTQSNFMGSSKKRPLILRRSTKRSKRTKTDGGPSDNQLRTVGQESISNKVLGYVSNQIEDSSSRKVCGAKPNDVEVISMEHMTNCFVMLVDVLKQKQITKKYLSRSKEKEGRVTKVNSKRNSRANAENKNEFIIDLTDDPSPSPDVPCKRKRRRTRKFLEMQNEEFENQIRIAESFQHVDMIKLYGGFIILQSITRFFECSSLSSVYVKILCGISLVESSVEPSFKPGFLYTPLTRELETNAKATAFTVFVNSELVSSLKDAIRIVKTALEKQLVPLIGLERENLSSKQSDELAATFERLKSEVAVAEMALQSITNKNPLDPELLKANAVKYFPCVEKLTAVHLPSSSSAENSSAQSKNTLKAVKQPHVKGTESQSTVPIKPIDQSPPQSIVFVMLVGENCFGQAEEPSSEHGNYLVIVQMCYDFDTKPISDNSEKSPPSVEHNSAGPDVTKGFKPGPESSAHTTDILQAPITPDPKAECANYKALNALRKTHRGIEAFLQERLKPTTPELEETSLKLISKMKSSYEDLVKIPGEDGIPSSDACKSKVIRLVVPKVNGKDIVIGPLMETPKTSHETASKTHNDNRSPSTESPVASNKAPNVSSAPKTLIKCDGATRYQEDGAKPSDVNQTHQTVSPTAAMQMAAKSYARVDATRLYGGFIMLEHAASNLTIAGVNRSTLSVLKVAAITLSSIANDNVALMLVTDFFDSSRPHVSEDEMAREKGLFVYIKQCDVSRIASSSTSLRSIIQLLYPICSSRKDHGQVPPRALEEVRLIVEDWRALVSEVKDQITAGLEQNQYIFPEELLSRAVTVRIIIPEQANKVQKLDVGLNGVMLAFSWLHIMDIHHDEVAKGLAALMAKRKCMFIFENGKLQEVPSRSSSKAVTIENISPENAMKKYIVINRPKPDRELEEPETIENSRPIQVMNTSVVINRPKPGRELEEPETIGSIRPKKVMKKSIVINRPKPNRELEEPETIENSRPKPDRELEEPETIGNSRPKMVINTSIVINRPKPDLELEKPESQSSSKLVINNSEVIKTDDAIQVAKSEEPQKSRNVPIIAQETVKQNSPDELGSSEVVSKPGETQVESADRLKIHEAISAEKASECSSNDDVTDESKVTTSSLDVSEDSSVPGRPPESALESQDSSRPSISEESSETQASPPADESTFSH